MDRIERFLSHVDQTDGCWNWTGYRDKRGYGKASNGNRTKDWAHRVAYRLFVGPIPDGLTLDHLCCNVSCVRPDHLEAVTRRENIRRANPERTLCKHGHSLADAYVEVTPAGFPHKKCATCVRERVRRYNQRLASRNATAEGSA